MSTGSEEKPAPGEAPAAGVEPRHILITQCLQNDLFLDPECRLFIGDEATRKLLVAKQDYESYRAEGDPRRIPPELLARGPLALFLNACIGQRIAGVQPGLLHVINIRDWHRPDASYDAERRLYGRHCEAGSWGAGYVDGLEQYLDPEEPRPDGKASFSERGTARIYHVHSDSVFDFRPRWDEHQTSGGKFHPSELERLLDVLVAGDDKLIGSFAGELKKHSRAARRQSQVLNELALTAVASNAGATTAQLYVAVIGVFTDIKVQILLAGLRARYELANLAVSDTLTASRSLERHLRGLDFSDKLLGVEVIHGLGDLACFLGTKPPLLDESETVGAENYSRYRTFFGDKQSVLAYESEKLEQYAQLTGRRAIGVYDTVKRANTFLLVWGSVFLGLTIVGTILQFVNPDRWKWQTTAITGGVGLLQLVSAFFSKPMRDLQQNLNNLAAFRMVLEGHSLKTAFTRFHLTTPEVLRELKEDGEIDKASAQIASLRTQLAVIDRFQASDYDALARAVGFSIDDQARGVANGGNGTAADKPAEDKPAADSPAEA